MTRDERDRFIDISPVLEPAIGVWPGDTPLTHTINFHLQAGANITLSDIRTTLHVGAHTDAPSHYAAGGGDIASRPIGFFVGRCRVVHVAVARGARILPSDVEGKTLDAPRVLFRTGTFPDPRRWNNDFASLSPELVDLLHERGVVLVGIDTPSVDPFESKELEAHAALARHDMQNLEGIVLDGVEEGEYELIALPLRIRDGDASPVRAVLRRLG